MIRPILFSCLVFVSFYGCKTDHASFCDHQKNVWEIPEPAIQKPDIPDDTLNITDFGAVGDGHYDNTNILNDAIDSCNKAGGGTLIIPPGTYFTGPVYLKSYVELHLQKGAELIFSDDPKDYLPPVFTRWEGIECYNYSPLIYAKGCHDIAITGKGKINGNGQAWWSYRDRQKETLGRLYDMVMKNVPVEQRVMPTREDTSFLRPSLIQFIDCQRIYLEDYTITSGPMWTNHLVYCTDVTVKGLRVVTEGVNNDGIIPDASENILIDSCFFSTGDDCIVIKSGLNEDGWRVGKASRNIWVRNCNTRKGHGGVVIGSEMSGGVENVYVENCKFNHTDRGIRVKSMKGRGGFVRNLYVRNIDMKNISYEAILLNMKYPSSSIQPRGDSLPDFRDIFIRDVHCVGASDGIKLTGLSGKNIEDVYLRNISGRVRCGMKIRNVKNVFLENIDLFAKHDTAMYFNAIDSICFNNVDMQNEGVWASFSNTDRDKVFTKNVDEDFIKSLSEVGLK